MRIRNATYAGMPISTKLGTFTPDATGLLDVSEEVGKLLVSLAGFVSLERTPRVLTTLPEPPAPEAPAEAPAPPQEAPAPSDVPAVFDVPSAPLSASEAPASTPADDVRVVMTPKRPKGPKPKT